MNHFIFAPFCFFGPSGGSTPGQAHVDDAQIGGFAEDPGPVFGPEGLRAREQVDGIRAIGTAQRTALENRVGEHSRVYAWSLNDSGLGLHRNG